jgi:hypothetical protein
VKLPLVKVEKGRMTDARLGRITKEKLKVFSGLLDRTGGYSPVILPQREISGARNTRDKGILPVRNKGKRGELEDEKGMCAIKLTTQEKDMLMDVWRNPTSSVTERYQRLSHSSFTGNKLQNSLVRSGLICSSLVVVPRGRVKILTLTEKGKKVLGIRSGESDRQGGPEHRYWVKRIADHLKARGYKVAEEVSIGEGKTIDIVTTRDGKRIAFEIETGKSDPGANVQKCLDAGLDRVIVVATSASERDKLLAGLPGDKRVMLLTGPEILQKKSG